MKQQTELEDLIVDAAGELAESLSLNRVVGRLYALLYISPEPVSLDEMARRLQISKASASVNIRVLEDWNAAQKVLVRGSRKDFYTADADLVKIVSERLEQGLVRRLSAMEGRLGEVRRRLPEKGGSREADFYRERIQKLAELKALAEKFPPLLAKLRSRGGLGLLKAFL